MVLEQRTLIGRTRDVAVIVCLASMGMHWVRLLEFGPYSFEAYHVGTFVLILGVLLTPGGIQNTVAIGLRNALWLVPYIAYLGLLLPASTGTSGFGIWARQVYFVLGAICAASYFANAKNTAVVARIGSLIGVGAFILTLQYSAIRAGLNPLNAIVDFVSSGNTQVLVYRFFRPTFNALVPDEGELTFGASISNSISASLLVLTIVVLAAGPRSRRLDIVGFAVFGVIILLVTLLNSRSVLLAGLIGGALGVACGAVRRGFRSWQSLLFGLMAALGGVAAMIAVVSGGGAGLQATLVGLEFDDASTQGRLEQYAWAISLIDNGPIFGNGYTLAPSGLPIHNLFLSAWAYAGIFAFIAVCMFYVNVLYRWLSMLVKLVSGSPFWILEWRPEWVLILPSLLLFRVWVSGGGGHPAFAEWIALGVFIGVLTRNADARAERQRASSTHPSPRRSGSGRLTEVQQF